MIRAAPFKTQHRNAMLFIDALAISRTATGSSIYGDAGLLVNATTGG